ncbi:hypothetical protein [Pelomonas sp. SE-A7]|uniref:hypothetical protein n=1 Tax=Pelomonas sp. SE-A7 TaxID=3054953 RepID=UPI00259C728C|nr:hypothetical protein [Pelomonas sp. SE-A7]MDM4767280.1 hypothetical protein [Pelomonas sp. SE-A7]
MTSASQLSNRWLKHLPLGANAEIVAATAHVIRSFEHDLAALFTADLPKLRLRYLLDAVEPPGIASISAGARDAALSQGAERLALMDDMVRDGKFADATVTLCELLCEWAAGWRDDANQEAHKRGQLRAFVKKLRSDLPKLKAPLAGSLKAIDEMERRGLCTSTMAVRLRRDIQQLIDGLDDKFSLPRSDERGTPRETELASALMHVLVLIGFDGPKKTYPKTAAALYASALAARHGFALQVNSLTTYASRVSRQLEAAGVETPRPSVLP